MIEGFVFRDILPAEAEQAVAIETTCFPPHEACPPEMMRDRVAAAPDLFLVAVDEETGKLAGFLNGLATDETAFSDAFFKDTSLHNPHGDGVMLLGLCVLPDYREKGLAHAIVERYKERERARGRRRLVLTCLEEKVALYQTMDFEDLGLSASVWGGESWHEMICKL